MLQRNTDFQPRRRRATRADGVARRSRRAPEGADDDAVRALTERVVDGEHRLWVRLCDVPACASTLATLMPGRRFPVGYLCEVAGRALREPLEDSMRQGIQRLADAAAAARWALACAASEVAGQEARRLAGGRAGVDDLEQEGMLGLLSAAERFDPSRGVRFTAYARWWVRAKIYRSIQRTSSFGVSFGAIELHRKLVELERADAARGVTRSRSESADLLGICPERLREIVDACGLRRQDNGDDPTWGALEVESRADEQIVARDLSRWLRETIPDVFSTRERYILDARHLDVDGRSVQDVADSLQLSTERVRQVERECLALLRARFAREMAV